MSEREADPRARASATWIALAVAVSAVYSLVVLVLPARGLTFLFDDWVLLDRFVTHPWPERWLLPHNEHWFPLFTGVFDLEWRAFGARHTAYLVTTWVVHVGNVALLALLLERVLEDGRAAALGAAAFGLSTAYRTILWWAECGGMALALTITLAGFLALERAARGSRAATLALAATTFLAPMTFDAALALGPALALGAILLLPRERRLAAASGIAGAWLAFVALSVAFTRSPAERGLPQNGADAVQASFFFARSIGLGVWRENFLLHTGVGDASAALTLAAYAAAVGAACSVVPKRPRLFLLALQAFFVCHALPMALVRWSWLPEAPLMSRHQYLPGVAWTATLAALLSAGLRRSRLVALFAVLALGLLAAGHARMAALDPRVEAPGAWRRAHVVFVAHLVSATTSARHPVFDPRLPQAFEGFMALQAHDVVDPLAGVGRVAWTLERTADSVAPYQKSDTFLAPLGR